MEGQVKPEPVFEPVAHMRVDLSEMGPPRSQPAYRIVDNAIQIEDSPEKQQSNTVERNRRLNKRLREMSQSGAEERAAKKK